MITSKNEIVAAVDIGTTKIVALVGKKDSLGKLRVLGIGKLPSKGVKRGVIQNIEETVQAIRGAVEQAQNMAGVQIADVFVGIAGQHIRSLRNRGYKNRESYDIEISEEDIKDLKADMYRMPIEAGEQIIHVLPQSYTVDNESGVKKPVGMFGKRLEANFLIVIGLVTSINNIIKCVNRVNLGVAKLILEPLASSYAVLTPDEKEAGVALIDIGGGTTDVAVYYDGIIRHTAVIPFGGDAVTADIKSGFNILERYAEQIKVQYGSALAEITKENEVVTVPGISGREPKEIALKALAGVIQSRMEEIIDAAYFQIDNSGFGNKLGAGIVVTGGGALLKNLPQLFAYKTGMDIRIGYPVEHLGSDVQVEINHPMFSTGIGLLLEGFDIMNSENPPAITNTVREKPQVVVKDEIEEKEEEYEEETEEEEEEVEKKPRRKPLEGIKEMLGSLFNDPKME